MAGAGAGVSTGENGCGVLVAHHRLKLESPDMLCWLSSPVAEATDGGVKCFVDVKVNLSGLKALDHCWSSMTRPLLGINDYEGSGLPSGLLLLLFASHLALLSGLDGLA